MAKSSSTKLIRESELRDMIPVSHSTVWRYVNMGVLPPPVKIGRNTFWAKAEVEAAIKKLLAARPQRGSGINGALLNEKMRAADTSNN